MYCRYMMSVGIMSAFCVGHAGGWTIADGRMTDGNWTFAADLRGGSVAVGKCLTAPEEPMALDLSTPVTANGVEVRIAKLDPRFGRRGPDTKWAGVGGPLAGSVGALVLPGEGLSEIGDLAFTGCSNATGRVVFPKSLTKIGTMGFCRSGKIVFESCPFGEGVKTLPGSFFEQCTLPDTMSFPYVEEVDAAAFKGSDVKSVSFGGKLRKINGGYGSGVFTDCHELRSVKFDPAAETECVASFLFNGCSSLIEADLRSMVKITCPQGMPFEGCRQLRIVRFGPKLDSLPKDVFKGVAGVLTEIHYEDKAPVFEGKKPNRATVYLHKDGKWSRPTVTIETTVDADEAKGGYGYFLVSRGDGDPLESVIYLRYSVGGTAKPGQTYCSLFDDVEIPSGAKSVKVKIRPLNDPKTKEDATVTLKLEPSESYAIANGEAELKVRNGEKYGGYLYADAGRWNLLAHMGNSGVPGAPKANTVAAAKYVLDRGFAFENDIQISTNGVMYLDHDRKDRVYLQDWPDTFENTLRVVPTGAVYKVDAKCGMRGLDRFIAGVKADNTHERALVTFNSWDYDFCKRVHDELPGAQFWLPVMVSNGDKTKPFDHVAVANRIVRQCRDWGAEGISIMWVEDVCTDEFFEVINAAGIVIDVWTIDDMRTLKEAVNRGARFVTTNRPVPISESLPWAADPN